MRASTEANAAYGAAQVTEGVFTRIPRWTHAPVPGTAEHGTALPAPLLATLRQLADRLEVPLSSVLLAAHAKVLAALSGDHEVTTGCLAAPGGTPLPCRLTTASGSWRALVLDAHRAADRAAGAPGTGRWARTGAGPGRGVPRDRIRPPP